MRAFVLLSLIAAALAGAVFLAPSDASDDALRGLWSRHPYGRGGDSDPVSFYYFHDGGIGLYRYGKVAYNNTHSYHYSADDSTLTLKMNKTGVAHALAYRIERGEGAPVLVIAGDPHNPGAAETRYTWIPPPAAVAGADDLFLAHETGTRQGLNNEDSLSLENDEDARGAAASVAAIDNRLWMDLKRYQTGGIGFGLYQLRPAGIDGRGTGWHHVGDFDDWSTEALAYRVVNVDGGGKGLAIAFTLRGDRALTPLAVAGEGKDRTLTLASDPRDFWAAHTYVDAGPSFGFFGAAIAAAAPDR